MRLPSFPSIIRTFSIFSNYTRAATNRAGLVPANLHNRVILTSMPSIPFLGSFFSSSAKSSDMSYPDNRGDQEWQAVLNKGMRPLFTYLIDAVLTLLKSSSVSSAKKALKPHSPVNMTSTCPMKESIHVRAAMHPCIKRTTNSSLAAVGLHTSTTSLVL